ncbi:Crp/Fnr family transcriptional regulator [Pedobacter sp. L105]|uniref:Crp/Fnr family transcriptional regulator n=1 Tax=Pedobacter sp. L105 TaxID=1641871 RepID=UPI00131AE865|nr:Crp/Fnr family transcriptional regulator [Pedobacter sp. L105]
MTALLFSNFNRHAQFTDDEYQKIKEVFTKSYIRKKKNLVNEGDISKYIFFVEKGCLRSFTVNKDGSEHVVQLAIEDHWIADLSSFITQMPGTINIEAIEDSEVLLLPHQDLERLYHQVPSLEKYFRQLYQRAYVGLQQRLNSRHSSSAEERYRELIKLQPHLTQRVPLIYIASYLGITPESLSRIRKQMHIKVENTA